MAKPFNYRNLTSDTLRHLVRERKREIQELQSDLDKLQEDLEFVQDREEEASSPPWDLETDKAWW